jgi:dihydropyrimidinase
MLDLVFKGGLAILPAGPAPVDLGVLDGRIAAIGERGSLEAATSVDVQGMVLLPGGVDPHVHIGTRFGSWTTRDDFYSGTVGAAHGGTTSIIEFAIPEPEESAALALEKRLERARAKAVVDYGFHACVTGHRFDESLRDLGHLPARGIGSVKIFTTYLDSVGITMDHAAAVLDKAAAAGMLVLVHAETDDLIHDGIAREVAAGNLSPVGHLRSRSSTAEADAVARVGALAAHAGAAIYIVHVSSREGMLAVADLKRSGNDVVAETCVQYLVLDDSIYSRPDGELFICSPPIRSIDDQAALWNGVVAGIFDAVSTDHNCFDSDQKAAHKEDFRLVPNGLPGVELRTPVALEAVHTGRLSWTALARLTAEAPARIFGLWPRKGGIVVGADADLVVVEPNAQTDLGVTHMASDYSPFRGITAHGAVRETWLRGNRVVAEGRMLGQPGSGAFLPTRWGGRRSGGGHIDEAITRPGLVN